MQHDFGSVCKCQRVKAAQSIVATQKLDVQRVHENHSKHSSICLVQAGFKNIMCSEQRC